MSTLHGKNDPEKKELGIIIPDEIRKALEKAPIPEKQRKEIAISIASYFQGPIPPPSLLKEYDDVVQNGAERIFAGYESQRNHRQALERHAIHEQLSQSKRGKYLVSSSLF